MPYAYQPVDPMQSFSNSFQFVQGIKQQQAQQQRQQALQEAMANIRNNPDPQNIADFYLRFPEMKENFDAYREALGEGDKGALEGAAREAIITQKTGGDVADVYERYAVAAENSRRPDLAQQFRDAKRMAEMSPEGADLTARMFYQQMNPDGYKAIFGNESATTFQKDFAFIKETFGEDAAAEFAQFGRDSIVSIPVGPGQTYVGPASMAPGASRWSEQQRSEVSNAASGGDILAKAAKAKAITEGEARVIRQSLGPKGNEKFSEWMTENNVKVIVRTGTDASGRRVVQYDDGTIEYAPE